MAKQATQEEKMHYVREAERMNAEGLSIRKAAERLNVNFSNLVNWRRKFGGDHAEPSREIVAKSNGHTAELKQLRIDNQRLRFLVSDLSLDKQALVEALGRR